MEQFTNCNICPHHCNSNRKIGQIGNCKAGAMPKVALVHYITMKNLVLVEKTALVQCFFLIVICIVCIAKTMKLASKEREKK